MALLLHDYFRSSASYRVRIALNLKGLSYRQQSHHLVKGEHRAPAYLTINPQGFVPTLVDGAVTITQSLAIIEYLEEAYPDTPRVLPMKPAERARVRSLSAIIAADTHPLNNLRVLKYLETVPEAESRWRGECFVFDQRVAIGHGLAQGSYDLCHACRRPLSVADRQSALYEAGVSCAACHGERSDEQRAAYRERHRQQQLAVARGEQHVGAEYPDA